MNKFSASITILFDSQIHTISYLRQSFLVKKVLIIYSQNAQN